MIPEYILCHYAEIGTKGKNRIFFENKLRNNLKESLKLSFPGSVSSIRRLHDRLLITLSDNGKNSLQEITGVIKNVPGIAYCLPSVRTEPHIEKINEIALSWLKELSFETFRITARKSDHQFPISSQKINETVGAYIVDNLSKKVKLKNPDVNFRINLVRGHAFLSVEKIEGLRGLPVGSGGKGLSMISGGIDSPVASYFAMKRGVKLDYIHFHSVPYTSRESIEKVRENIQVLNKYQICSRLWIVPFASIQKEIMTNSNERLRVVLYRRFMFRIAESIAKKVRAKAIITGESIGQVASQTLENIGVIEHGLELPVLRPLVGFDKQDIVNTAKQIETYDISIRPDEDCCSLFVPKHPATKSRLADVLEAESNLDCEVLVQEAIDSCEKEDI